MENQILSSVELASLIDGMDARGASKLIQSGILPGSSVGRGFFTSASALLELITKVPTVRLTERGKVLLKI
jgi:hypothetical protein